ncbi:16961_t:CDS:2, partial [Gigaspora rosea]
FTATPIKGKTEKEIGPIVHTYSINQALENETTKGQKEGRGEARVKIKVVATNQVINTDISKSPLK